MAKPLADMLDPRYDHDRRSRPTASVLSARAGLLTDTRRIRLTSWLGGPTCPSCRSISHRPHGPVLDVITVGKKHANSATALSLRVNQWRCRREVEASCIQVGWTVNEHPSLSLSCRREREQSTIEYRHSSAKTLLYTGGPKHYRTLRVGSLYYLARRRYCFRWRMFVC